MELEVPLPPPEQMLRVGPAYNRFPDFPAGLPLLVWDEIFNHINDPKDIYNIMNVNRLFRVMMCQAKPLWEFGLPIFLRSQRWCKSMAFRDVHQSRLVCRDWDRHFREHREDILMNYIRMNDTPVHAKEPGVDANRIITCEVKDLRKIEQILEKLRGTIIERPLLYHSLTIGFPRYARDNIADYFIGVRDLLRAVGRGIWELHVTFTALVSRIDMYSNLQAWILLLPKLRSLTVIRLWNFPEVHPDLPREHVAAYPFPKLDDLERFHYDGIEHAAVCAILEANPHVKRIKVGSASLHQDLDVLNPLNLEALSMPVKFIKNIRKTFELADWPLTKIHMDLENVTFTLEEIFNLLQKFQSLEQVMLKGGNAILRRRTMLNLPNLKIFKCCMKTQIQSIDFLMPCKKLEIISIYVPFYDSPWAQEIIRKKDDQDLINFKGHVDSLDETSNVWTLFPELKQVRFLFGHEPKIFKKVKLRASEIMLE